MNRWSKMLALVMGTALAGTASAGHDRYGPEYAWARVLSVDPIIETYDVPVGREVCWDEPVEYYEPRYAYRPGYTRDNSGATVLGALVGAALGNQVGHGDGRRAATIAGAVIGGSIANDRARRRGYYQDVGGEVHRSSERVCDTRTEYRTDERVIGYDVEYEYHGRSYRTRTDAHPGNRIRVVVDVDVHPAR